MGEIFISVVSPIYRAESIVRDLVERIENTVSQLTGNYEIILVDDGSPDNSWCEMERISSENRRVKSIKLSRNFGQHYAITAGLDHAQGEWVVVMDCDLQDQPEEIPAMLEIARNQNAHVVLAQRLERNDNFFKVLLSGIFYAVLSYLSGVKWDASVANFGVYNKEAIRAINSLREPIRFFPSMVKWVGFKVVKMPVEHGAREEGKSTYNFKKRMNLALDIILANSDKPLRQIVKLGLTISLVAALVGVLYIIMYFSGRIVVMGYTSIMLSIWFIGGLIFMMLGIIGLYIGKIFEGVKNRPIYIIEQVIGGGK